MKNPGMEVITKSGKRGRTYNNKGLIQGKVPVYLCTLMKPSRGVEVCVEYSEQAILCDPATLKTIGFID